MDVYSDAGGMRERCHDSSRTALFHCPRLPTTQRAPRLSVRRLPPGTDLCHFISATSRGAAPSRPPSMFRFALRQLRQPRAFSTSSLLRAAQQQVPRAPQLEDAPIIQFVKRKVDERDRLQAEVKVLVDDNEDCALTSDIDISGCLVRRRH